MCVHAIASELGLDFYTVRDHVRELRRANVVGVGDRYGRRKINWRAVPSAIRKMIEKS